MKTTTGIFSAILLAAVLGAPQAASAKSIAGLTGWWKMDGNLNDSSGNGNHGAEVNDGSHAIGYQAAAPGGGTGTNALAFPNNTEGPAGWGNSTGFVQVPACCGAGNGGTTISLGGWVKPIDEDAGTTSVISSPYPESVKLEIRNRGTGQDFSPTIWLGKDGAGQPTEIRNGTRLSPGTWWHVVTVYDGNVSGTNAITYVNGAATVPGLIVANGLTNPIAALEASANPISFGDGQPGRPMQAGSGLDELFIFDTALSADQVLSIYNSGVDSIPEPSALVLLGTGAVSMLIRRRRSA